MVKTKVGAESKARRLPKAERRRQLLDLALAIVREQGAGALTLATLAARAGVTKPVAYEHFTTREGLLFALYQSFDRSHAEAAQLALARCSGSLGDVAGVIAAAYIDCAVAAGRECSEIEAALAAIEGADAVQHRQQDRYVALYRNALGTFLTGPRTRTHGLLVALVGAADALAAEVRVGRAARRTNVGVLAAMIVSAVAGHAPRGNELANAS